MFVSGEPALFLTRRERDWKQMVAFNARGSTFEDLTLIFTVSSYLRGGNAFDVDNLAKPVVEALAARPRSLWVKINTGSTVGVEALEAPPPHPPSGGIVFYETLPRSRSVKPIVPMLAFLSAGVVGDGSAPVGLDIEFDDPDTPIWDLGFNGPIKPLIDGLGPILGAARQGPADHRIKDLRLRRGRDLGRRGAAVTIWPLVAE